jgi:hypothetical protein
VLPKQWCTPFLDVHDVTANMAQWVARKVEVVHVSLETRDLPPTL